MTRPQTISLDGQDWTAYPLPPGDWQRLRIWEADPPDAGSRRPAVVPSHALDAVLPPGSEERERLDAGQDPSEYAWVAERDWVFEKRFEAAADLAGMTLRLRFEGVDDAAHVFLNGEKVGDHQGQFVPVEWDVSALIRPGEPNQLLVVVEAAPEEPMRRWKALFPYAWGGLVPTGIWDSVSLFSTGEAAFHSVSVHTNISNDQTAAAVSVVTEFRAVTMVAATVVADITLDGLPVTSVEDPIRVFPGDTALVQSCEIPRVRLWHPNGIGAQPLYQARLSLVTEDGRLLDQRFVQFGVRKIDAIPCDGARPDTLPYGVSVNGRRVWIQGMTWLPLDRFYASAPAERYERLLRLAKDAGINMLRVWGGGLLEKEAFYRLCDRFGIMVWQEFPHSSVARDAAPPSDRAYLDLIAEQAEAMLPRRRNHPSLVLWCGGDALTDAEGAPLGTDHPALAELRLAVDTDDPQRLWLPASPSGPHAAADRAYVGELHDAHGPREWLGPREHPGFHNAIDPLLHTAFSAGSGPEAAAGLQYAIEANRRRQWRSAGALPWCLNEPWPGAAPEAIIDYAGNPRPTYEAVKAAYAPFHVSAAFPTFAWDGEGQFRADIWLHNNGPERSLLNVVAIIQTGDGRELYQENLAAEAPENGSENAGDLLWRFPADFAEPFDLLLEVIDEEGDTIARNRYRHTRSVSRQSTPTPNA